MRAAVCERPAYGAYEHDAKADSANIGFRQDVIAAAQQFHAENAPVKNEQDERGGQPPHAAIFFMYAQPSTGDSGARPSQRYRRTFVYQPLSSRPSQDT